MRTVPPYRQAGPKHRYPVTNSMEVILETLGMHNDVLIKATGISRTSLVNYISGRSSPTPGVAIEVITYLKNDLGLILSLDHIYNYKDVKPILEKYMSKFNIKPETANNNILEVTNLVNEIIELKKVVRDQVALLNGRT